jgi:hypothetical protein
VGLVAALTACAGPTFSSSDYDRKAAATVATLTSEVATARLATAGQLQGRAVATYTETVLVDSENAISDTATTFLSRQPPSPQDDATRDAVSNLVDQSSSAVADARIALRRGDTAGLQQAADAMASAAQALQGYGES